MPMTAPGKFDSNGAWDGFRGEIWQEEINVRDFIQKNYTPYDGDESFLTGLHPEQKSYGTMFRSFRRKSARKAACWNVKQKWFPDLPHMVLAISVRI